MSTLRKQAPQHDGLPVNYSKDVTEDQVRKIEETVREEFESGDWVPVERET